MEAALNRDISTWTQDIFDAAHYYAEMLFLSIGVSRNQDQADDLARNILQKCLTRVPYHGRSLELLNTYVNDIETD